MTIPPLTLSGTLPPFQPGYGPTDPNEVSPFRTDLVDVVHRFALTPHRQRILQGLLDYRQQLRSIGFTSGFQWLDGSYLEDCENYRGRAPKDIDVVTFAPRPTAVSEQQKWLAFSQAHLPTLFDPKVTKQRFLVDAYFVDLGLPPAVIVKRTRYWFGLFSHQRATMLWKGMLEVPLSLDDSPAQTLLKIGGANAS